MHRHQLHKWLWASATLLTVYLIVNSFAVGTSTESTAQNTAATPFELIPGVVLAPRRGVILLMNPNNAVDALDISTGKILWSSKNADKPLLVHGDYVVGIRGLSIEQGTVHIATLNLETGDLVHQSTIRLPGALWTATDNGPGQSLITSAWVKAGNVYISWKSTASAVPTMPGQSVTEQMATGLIQLNLASGHIRIVAPDMNTEAVPAPLPTTVTALLDAGKLKERPRLAGNLLVQVEARGFQELNIRRWQAGTGKELANLSLASEGFVAWRLSANNLHMLYARYLDTGPSAWERYRWFIHSIATGKLLTTITSHSSVEPYVVWRNQLIRRSLPYGRQLDGKWFNKPLELHGKDTTNGELIWRHSFRDTSYRGGVAPNRGPPPPGLP